MRRIQPIHKNKTAICFASNEAYVEHLSIALASIVYNANRNNFYDIVVLNDGIGYENVKRILTWMAGSLNVSIRFYDCINFVSDNDMKGNGHISGTAFLRLLIPEIFANYTKVIYLDCDLIINKDISTLFEVNLDDKCIASCVSTIYSSWCFENTSFSRLVKKYISDIVGLDSVYDFINSGVIVFDIKKIFSEKITTNYLLETAKKYNWKGLDEDVLNYVFRNKIKFLDLTWNVMVADDVNVDEIRINFLPSRLQLEYLRAYRNPNIIHYAGKQQPIYNSKASFSKLFWKFAKFTPFFSDIKEEESRYKKSFKFKIKSVIRYVFPRYTRRWLVARRISRIFNKPVFK